MATAYERRRRILKKKRELRQEQKKLDALEHQDRVMLLFEIAFNEVYGYKPSVYYRRGWYVHTGRHLKRYRDADLQIETQRLWALKHNEEISHGDLERDD